jgi:hypothetical protein
MKRLMTTADSPITVELKFKLRFGHAFPSLTAPAEQGVPVLRDLLVSAKPITARPPADPTAVETAERALVLTADKRPVYAFLGDLHPELGRIGLVLHDGWVGRDPHGVSRCDTGGLAKTRGGFAALSEEEAVRGIPDLTYPHPRDWIPDFWDEVERAFATRGFEAYVAGEKPDAAALTDIRGRCVDHPDADRRVWTWEARTFGGIQRDDVVAVFLSHEAGKEFWNLSDEEVIPDGVEVVIGDVSADGVVLMDGAKATAVLQGRS